MGLLRILSISEQKQKVSEIAPVSSLHEHLNEFDEFSGEKAYF